MNEFKLYRGQSPAEYGLWRKSDYGYWLFCVPVVGNTWRRVDPPDMSNLIPLGDVE